MRVLLVTPRSCRCSTRIPRGPTWVRIHAGAWRSSFPPSLPKQWLVDPHRRSSRVQRRPALACPLIGSPRLCVLCLGGLGHASCNGACRTCGCVPQADRSLHAMCQVLLLRVGAWKIIDLGSGATWHECCITDDYCQNVTTRIVTFSAFY